MQTTDQESLIWRGGILEPQQELQAQSQDLYLGRTPGKALGLLIVVIVLNDLYKMLHARLSDSHLDSYKLAFM